MVSKPKYKSRLNEDSQRHSLIRVYEASSPLGIAEVNREQYLSSISIRDRNNLLLVINTLFPDEVVRAGSFALLAVGTTTYGGDYWAGLSAYLQDKDKNKLGFVRRRGEDIDLQICPEHDSLRSTSIATAFKLMKRVLREKNLDFVVEKDKSECGTGYIHYKKDPKDDSSPIVVERYKRVEYGQRKIRVLFPNSRPHHIFFEEGVSTEEKLKIERTRSMPFSLLFRHNDYSDLQRAIGLVNGYENQRKNLANHRIS